MYAFLNVKKKLKIQSGQGRCQLWAYTCKHTHMNVCPHAHLCHMSKTGKYTFMHTHKVITCIDVLFYSHFIFNLFV